jgi:serine/threonine protein kinase
MEEALRTSVWLTSPEYSGWLMKRGFHWRKLWKKRWVAISGAELAYADSEPNPSDPGSKVVVKKCPITSAMIIDREDIDGNPNGFAVHINDGKSPPWYLRADSLRDKKSWLMRLGHVQTIVKWLDDFERVKVLGVGGTGIVYELLSKTDGRRFAMKEMEIKNAAQMRMALKEAEMLKDIMENISHPNIMQIEKVFQVGTKFYMVFPLCTGGELYDAITRRGHFTEGDAARLMRDLISGLNSLHKHDILHLDIKPENLLFDTTGPDAKIKITDFGLSKVFSDAESRREEPTIEEIDERRRVFFETGLLHREQLRGTVGYMSPELILLGVQCKATDIWAAGVVLYILLCGFPPFYSKSNREVLEKSARGLYSMDSKDWECVSEEAKDLVRQMLTVDLSKRITAAEILQHPFIVNAIDEPPLIDVEAVGATAVLPGSRRTQEVNLEGALRRLSDHVSSRRTEKIAMTLTKVMSTLRVAGGQGGEGRSDQKSSMLSLITGPLTTKSAKEIEEEVFTIMTSSDARKAMGTIFQKLGTTGKLTLEQFSSVLKHFGVADGSGVSGTATDTGGTATGQWLNMSGLLIAKFFDRDGDGLISTDDIFASQALILQRSEVFIRFVFRIYQEGVWYPGRQLNQMNWMAGMIGGGSGGTGGTKATTPSRTAVLSDGSTGISSVTHLVSIININLIFVIFRSGERCGATIDNFL